jgi:hypothetical protein
MTVSAARQLATIAAEIRLALDESSSDCPTWADQIVAVADSLDPSGFVDAQEPIDALTRLHSQLDATCKSLNAWEAAGRDNDVRLGLILKEVEGVDEILARADVAIARARVSGIDTGYTDWVARVIADA